MITDPLSCTYGNEIESKRVQFPGQNAPVKIRGGGYPDISKTVALYHKNTKIRMRSDETITGSLNHLQAVQNAAKNPGPSYALEQQI